MSFKHAIVFALLALVAVQGASALRLDTTDERSLIDLINKAKEAINKLTTIIRDAVNSALNKLGEIKDTIINTAKNVIEKAKEAIFGEIQKIKEQIEKIKEQAAAVGVDIKECLVDNQAALEEIPKKTISKLLTCISDEVAKAEAIIEGAIVDIIHIKDTVVDLPGNLKDCIISARPVKCLGNVIADVVSAITSVPVLITNKINEVHQLIANVEGELKACALRKVLEASKDAAIIGAKVAKCVADKIRE